MIQLELIDAIEKRLWSAADNLRANSNYASNEYFMPVMGLVFLRHAYSRYQTAKAEIEPTLPSRGGKTRPLTPQDFAQRGAIFLQDHAQFDTLVALPTGKDMAAAVIQAMESIEKDYPTLKGVLPKAEYQDLDDEVLRNLLRTLNPDELKQVTGDVFGRIYEYFLTQFANQGAHDDGEFFTPISLVSLIANVLEPDTGTVLDPACGSGGMFVQSARTVQQRGADANQLTFRGLEKNPTTIRLAKMNLAVHGLEGDIQKAISYYDDPHELVGKAAYVMANPPFNVDEIDAAKIKEDPRLPFGLPGTNKKNKVSNGNYVWISYFYSYLNDHGKAGFVMSSQASSAGRDEATVRRKLIETGAVEAMVAIRQNFFYTRSVPCELWFFNKAKVNTLQGQVLMIDARNVYRQVTRKINDFSPEQQQNLLAIVWLARGEQQRMVRLVDQYLAQMQTAIDTCFTPADTAMTIADVQQLAPVSAFRRTVKDYTELLLTMLKANLNAPEAADIKQQIMNVAGDLTADLSMAFAGLEHVELTIGDATKLVTNVANTQFLTQDAAQLSKQLRSTHKQLDAIYSACQAAGLSTKDTAGWDSSAVRKLRKTLQTTLATAQAALKQVGYFWSHADWLTSRFPDATFQAVPGLCALVDHATLEANDWSLTPGRYVGVALEVEDADFDFSAELTSIHAELAELDAEAQELALKISRNLRDLI